MKKTELDTMLAKIRKGVAEYESCSRGFYVVGIEIFMEVAHAHVRVFLQESKYGNATLVGFYKLEDEDITYIKEQLTEEGFYFRLNKGSGCTFIKLHND